MKLLHDIYIYRLTHIANVPHILRHGITHRNSANADSNYHAIGDKSLISYRSTVEITTSTGHHHILGDGIPFYFGTRMPMLWVIQHGMNQVPQKTPPSEIVYLVIRLSDLLDTGFSDYYFCDGHATDALTKFWGPERISDLPNLIDWPSVDARWWSGSYAALGVKRKKQAEFISCSDISPQLICKFICYDSSSRDRLQTMGIESNKILIDTQSYY